MSENATANMDLPLLMPAQAQKHVTVNDALLRVDGLVDLVLQSVTRATPPETVVEGQCWGVPPGAVNAWEGQAGRIAIGANGGWIFVSPGRGRRALVADRGLGAIHDGAGWVVGALSLGPHGSGMVAGQMWEDVVLVPGTVVTTAMAIPVGAMVIGATARVIEPITGTLTSWRLGHADAPDRYGSGLGKGAGSWVRGILGTPTTNWVPTQVQLSATGGQFAAGRVRVVLHWWELRLPD